MKLPVPISFLGCTLNFGQIPSSKQAKMKPVSQPT